MVLPLLILAAIFLFALPRTSESKHSTTLILVLGAFLLVPLVFMGPGMLMGPGMMGQRGWPGMGYGGFSSWNWTSMGVGLVVLAGLAALTVYALKRMPLPADGALQILRDRLAKGEITAEQYDDLKKRLQN